MNDYINLVIIEIYTVSQKQGVDDMDEEYFLHETNENDIRLYF